jgi:hypothetical protein
VITRTRRFLWNGDFAANVARYGFWAMMVGWMTVALIGSANQSIGSEYWPALGFPHNHFPGFGGRA